jgi:chlorobactene glucosyltransferase
MWLLPVVLAVALLVRATLKPRFLTPRTLAEGAIGLLIASLPFIIAGPMTPITKVALVVLQLWMIVIAFRLVIGRLDAEFINPSTRTNSITAGAMCVAVAGLWCLGGLQPGIFGGYDWRIILVLCAVFVVYALFAAQLWWSATHYKLRADAPHRKLSELPTVSVCIPARNETHALEDCLLSVLASNYPKLEVLVLDDCSQDKTSQIIRSFAHDGVRFVQGEAPADGWLGRNQALQTLATQATGDFILFMEVDTRLNVPTIAQLVDYTLDNKVDMISVLPQNRLGLQAGALFGTLRHYWQMVLPLTRRRVPVSSQAWLISSDTLRGLGGFKSVAHKIVPEGSFARRLQTKDAYRFISGNAALGITTAKRWSSELESAIRLLYPTYKRQPLGALGAIGGIFTILIAPYCLGGYLALTLQFNGLCALAALVCVFGWVIAALVLRQTHPRAWFLAALLLPVVALQEIFLIITSMIEYEFGEVNWKGRNVCYPVISSGRNQRAPRALQSHQ